MNSIKKDFAIFENQSIKIGDHDGRFIYLDSAATSLKPNAVIDTVKFFYSYLGAPVHRSSYRTANRTTEIYEQVRKSVAEFINAESEHEIVFTKNTNEAINLIANDLGESLTDRDVVVLSRMEHHANIVPWIKLQKKIKFKIMWLDINEEGRLDWAQIPNWPLKLSNRIRVVSLAHASNVLGTINPIKDIIAYIKGLLPNNVITFIVDGAQAVPHIEVDVQDLDCGYYVFSGHKMLGPSGVGVLYAKQSVLDLTQPLLYGSHMISWVTEESFMINEDESAFEAGTPNIEGVLGLGAAIDYLNQFEMGYLEEHDTRLTEYALKKLQQVGGITLYGPSTFEDRLGIFSFNVDGVHAHDTAQVLGDMGICVRAGHHCAMPLMDRLGVSSTVRASTYLYNTSNDIDELIKGIEEVKKVFKK